LEIVFFSDTTQKLMETPTIDGDSNNICHVAARFASRTRHNSLIAG
jgi:hypothetical protein